MANEFMNKFKFSSKDKEEYNRIKLEFNKFMSNINKNARKEANKGECYLCGKRMTSFCNSHSIPKFCLKNITTDGMIYSLNAAIEMPFMKEEVGVNSTGVFHLICQECDNSEFLEYENPDNYAKEPTSKMLSQIAMKTYLKEIHKKSINKKCYEKIYEMLKAKGYEFMMGNRLDVTELDLEDLKKDFKYTRRELLKGRDNTAWYMCYYKKLHYTVPFAFQNKITLISGLKNETINNVYKYTGGRDEPNDLHICIFPLDGFSVVILFVKDGSKKIRTFYKELRKLGPDDQLHVITYIVFLYSEEVYMSKSLEEIVKSNKALKEASSKDTSVYSVGCLNVEKAIQVAKEAFDLSKRTEFPNLLSEEYSKEKLFKNT